MTQHVVSETLRLRPPASDPDCNAHTLLAALAADHVAALLPELGEQRMRTGLLNLARSAM
ncbi:hypothetical protein ACIQWN_36530 [Streptomyces vinaceus]|uniref:hypothetical protein n=1 Tax=Streptomyces vinaceus TaxID=1960 RepID=UPI0038141524